MLALIAAIRREVQPGLTRLGLKRKGHGFYTGTFAGHDIIAQISGIGGDKAGDTALQLIKNHKPSALIGVGFSGGLSQSLKPGNVLHIHTVMKASGVAYTLSDTAPPLATRVHLPPKSETPETPGMLLTADRLIEGVADKSRLLKLTGCPAVDMETYWIAESCAHLHTPFISLRAISDPHDFALPAEAGTWINPDGEVRPIGLAKSITLRPWRIATLLTLGKHAKSAGDALAEELIQKIQSL
jgi:adenosylhomocysteine nucleosidase